MKQTEKRLLKDSLTVFVKEKMNEPSDELEHVFGVEEIAQVKEGVALKMTTSEGETVFATIRVTVKKDSFDFEEEKEEFERKRVEKLVEQAKKLDKLKEKEKELTK